MMYFDIQVNGYAGIDFNQNTLTLEGLTFACERLKEDGVSGILATFITADFVDMLIRIRNIVHFRNESSIIAEIVKGIHLEGPFISAEDGYRGAHPQQFVLEPQVEKMRVLYNACEGLLKIVTLAPENDIGHKVIRYLREKRILVAAGHCNPSLDELKSAITAGLSMFTHLGNGCPQQMHRHDNIVQRALSLRDDLWLCFIADGNHIPLWVLKNYIAIAGINKVIITTDAMAAAGAPIGKYTLGELELEISADRIARQPGKPNFAGSAIDMKSSEMNLAIELGLTPSQLYQLLCTNPLKALET